MSQPPTAEQAAAEKARKERVGKVVRYKHDDRVTGRELKGAGVIVDVEEGGNVLVRPLAAELLTVDPRNVSAASASDLS